jgi:subtilisin family serine protease
MNRIPPLALASALLVACAAFAAVPSARAEPPRWAPGEVLVRFRPAARTAQRAAALGAAGATPLRAYELGGISLLKVDSLGVEQAVAALARDPAVAWAEPNYTWSIGRVPNDTRYPDQWSLSNHGQGSGTPGADILAEAAWDVTTGDSTLVVGVLDTGLDLLQPDMVGNVWTNPGEIADNGIDDDGDGYVDDVHGWDFANRDSDPMDDNGHGTHVSGIIAATGNNAFGIAGVCWRTKIMALKFLAANGTGLTSNAIEALQFALVHHVRVTNNSWGGGPRSQALADAFAAAGTAGMLIVVAAGNSAQDLEVSPGYPGSYDTPELVVVAATDKNDNLADFSNYGLVSVDMAAPGDGILSLWPQRRVAILSGTSMAAPHVTGAAALLLARDPGMTPLAMKERLLRGATPLATLEGRCVSGGRLDLLRTLADPDTLAPGPIAGLRVTAVGSNSVSLAWTATGDDGETGTAYRYDLRVATAPIDSVSFESATRVGVGRPLAAGSTDSVRVLGLATQTTYWFALRAQDEFRNAGPVSESVTGTTLAPPHVVLSAVSLAAALRTGESVEREVTITNDSQGTLDWHVPPPSLESVPVPGPGGATVAGATAPVPGVGGAADGSAESPAASRARLVTRVEVPAAIAPLPPAKGELSARGAAQPASAGGPDAFGYRWLDSNAPGGPGYQWIDIASPGNLVSLSGDDALSAPVQVGFEFPFYGRNYSQVRVCTNGYLTFEEGEAAYGNVALPSPLAPSLLVAPFWDDLGFGFGARRAYARSDGARFVLSWVAVSRFADPLTTLTFQVVLEANGEIRFQYQQLAGETGDCTVGIQDGTRTVGLTVASDQPYLRDSLAVRLVPLPRWVSASPDSGSLGPGESATLHVRFDATGLGTEMRSSALHVLSNDPAAPDTAIAASLDATGIAIARLRTASLDFGDVQSGRRDTLRVLVENAGGAPLSLLGADAAAPFEALFGAHTLESGAIEALPVAYAPLTPGTHAGTLRIATADPANAELSLPLEGHAVPPPQMFVLTTALRLAAANGIGEAARRRAASVFVRNRGDSPLHWSARATQGASAPPAAARGRAVKGAAEPLGLRGSGAPDAAGYRWSDSDAPGGPLFAWDEISEAGARLFGGADDSTRTSVPLPFAFPFYGDTFTTVNVCTNGWLSFTSGSRAFQNGDLPDTSSATPRNLVAPFWDDLDLRPVGGDAAAFAWYDGEKFIVEWRDAAHFAVGGPYTFEALLWPDGAIDFQYLSMAGGADQATIGLQNGDGTVGLRVVWNAPYVHDRLRVRLDRRSAWLALDPLSGVTPAGGVDTLRVVADAEGWEDGEFAGEVRVAGDDPAAPLVVLPVALHVGALRAPATLAPRRLGAVSVAPQLALDVTRPPGEGELELATLALAGAPARTDRTEVTPDGHQVVYFDAIDLRARLPAGARVPLPFAGELTGGTWAADTVWAEVDRAGFAAEPLAAFGDPATPATVRAQTTIPLSWTAPPGADRVDVLHSADGGRTWTRVASTLDLAWPFVPVTGSAENLVELLAMRADTVAASWLSAPFAVVRRDLPTVDPAAPPAAFALRVLGARPGRLPVRFEWALPVAANGRVEVHDLRGARVRTLASGPHGPGAWMLAWDGRAEAGNLAAPGVYFVRAEAAGHVFTRRVVVLR